MSTRRNVNALSPDPESEHQNEYDYEYDNSGSNVLPEPQFHIEELTQPSSDKDELYATLRVTGNKHITLKLDTGAKCNVLPLKLYHQVGN